MKQCQKCVGLEKKYRVLEIEMNFEVRKLQEDMAQLKLTLDRVHQKQMKKLTEKLTSQRHDSQAETKIWMDKYDQVVKNYETKLENQKEQFQLQIRMATNQLQKQFQRRKQESFINILAQMEQLKAKNLQYRQNCLQIEEQYQRKMQKMHQQSNSKLIQVCEKQRQVISEEKQLLINEINQFKKQQSINKIVQTQLAKENVQKTREINTLKIQIGELQSKIALYSDKIRQKQRLIQLNQINFNEKMKKAQKIFQESKQKLIDENKNVVAKLLQKQLKSCEIFEQKLKEIEQKKSNQKQWYQKNVQSMKQMIDENKNLPKITEEMNHLKFKLFSTEKQVIKKKQQIKLCQLQMINNDQILTKFFLNPSLVSNSEEVKTNAYIRRRQVKGKKRKYSMNTSYLKVPASLQKFNETTRYELNVPVTSLENLSSLQQLCSKNKLL